MSNNSIIEHKGNYYYIEFREEYLIICLNCSYKKPVKKDDQKCKASPYCKALILAILEQWTNDKRGKGQDLAVYMTYPQWIDAMYGMFGRTAVIDSLEELIGEGLIARVPYRLHGKDTYKYLLNHVEINRRIRGLDERDPNITRPQVNASTSKSDPSTSKRVTRPQVNGYPSTSGHNIESTNKHNLDSSQQQEEEERVAVANATPLSPSQTLVSLHPEHTFLWGDDGMNPTRVVVYLTPAFPSRYYSEVEDKRREQIVAYEIMPYLEAKGLKVSLQWVHETEQEIEQAPAANENKTEPTRRTSEVYRLTSLPSPVVEEIVNPDETVSGNEAETQERATSSTVIETQGDTRNTTTEQTEPNIRIAQEVQQKEERVEEQPAPNKKRTTKPKPEHPVGPPELPPADVRFTPEVAVQIIEAKKGRRYSDATRTQELSAAKKVLAMEYEDEGITRERFEIAVDDLLSWPFWKQHTNVKPMIRTLLKDDKIINILDDLKRKPNKNRSLSKQREDVHRQAAVAVATSVPPIDAEKLEAEKQAKLQQARENLAKLNRLQEENLAKQRGAM
jgi:hypothetical protein